MSLSPNHGDPFGDGENPTDQDLYDAEYARCRAAGDDPMNARLRLLEHGASDDMALAAQRAAGETDDSDEEDGE